MATLGMTLTDTLTPVSKANFKKWHGEGALLFYASGNGNLDITLSRLNDCTHDYKSEAKQATIATIDGKQHKVFMFSNGCDGFIIVIDDMQASDYSKQYHAETGKNHLTVYVVA